MGNVPRRTSPLCTRLGRVAPPRANMQPLTATGFPMRMLEGPGKELRQTAKLLRTAMPSMDVRGRKHEVMGYKPPIPCVGRPPPSQMLPVLIRFMAGSGRQPHYCWHRQPTQPLSSVP